MTSLRTVFCLILTAVVGACATVHPLERGMCGGEDPGPWQRLSSPPANAAWYREVAKAQPVFPNSVASAEEWFSAPNRVLLCRRTSNRGGGEGGEWWTFTLDAADMPRLSGSDGWISTVHSIQGQ